MKPIMKLCIAVSITLFLLGVLGIGIGRIMGVTPSQLSYSGRLPGIFSLWTGEMQHPLEILQEEELSEALEETGEARLPDLEEPASLPGTNPSGREEYYEFQNIYSMDMDLSLCDLHIFQNPEASYISVAADRTQDYFSCRQVGSTLVLEDKRPSSTSLNSMDKALILDLYLPKREYEDISIDLAAGSITLISLSADTLDIDNGAGNVDIGTLSCRELEVDTGVGEFLAESIQASEEANIEIGTGTAAVSRFDGKELDLECGVGNAAVTLTGKEQDYNYRLEAAMGCIYLDHHLQDHSEHHSDSHHEDDYCLDVHNSAGRNISILCALGNAELNFTEEY